jgi:chromosome segregation ATPase
LKVVGSELVRAEEQVVRARAGTAALENVVASLKAELDAAHKKRTELQENMAESTSDNEQLRKELDSAQSQLMEKQAQGKELTAELEKTKSTADETSPARARRGAKAAGEYFLRSGARESCPQTL